MPLTPADTEAPQPRKGIQPGYGGLPVTGYRRFPVYRGQFPNLLVEKSDAELPDAAAMVPCASGIFPLYSIIKHIAGSCKEKSFLSKRRSSGRSGATGRGGRSGSGRHGIPQPQAARPKPILASP